MRNFKGFILLFLLLQTVILNAQNPIIKGIQNKFYSINNLSADFSQSSAMKNQGGALSIKGHLLYQKDDKYRIEFKNQQLISNGSTFWNYNKRSNKVVINDLKNEKSAFSFKKIIQDYPAKSKVESLGQETVNGTKCNLIRLSPLKNSYENFKSIRIWSDNDNLIRKIELIDNSGLTNVFNLSNIKLNTNIPGHMFSFEPPKGSEIVDLR